MSTKRVRETHRIPLSPDDQLDIVVHRVGRTWVAFTLNYRARIRDEWKEVIRFDRHHGRLHVHRFWRPPGRQVEHLEEEPSKDYRPQFQTAQTEIRKNWRRFRHLVEQGT